MYAEVLIIVSVLFISEREEGVAKFALDTGATQTLINTDFALMLGYDPRLSKERVQIVTGNGIEFTSRIRVHRIDALGLTKMNFPILCHTLPPSASIDGLLGLDFFKDSVLKIDFKQSFLSVD